LYQIRGNYRLRVAHTLVEQGAGNTNLQFSYWKLEADLCAGSILILFPIPMFEYFGAWELEAPGTESRTDYPNAT
jgi:hypothetical protein